MEKYFAVFKNLEKILGGDYEFNGLLLYTKESFLEEWLQNRDLNWENYLQSLLDIAQDSKIKLEKELNSFKEVDYVEAPNNDSEEEDEFSWVLQDQKPIYKLNHRGKHIIFDNKDYFGQKKFEVYLEKWTSIQNQLEHLNECMIYYRKNKNEVPFRESKLRHERIPFIGSQSEFIAIIFLLLEFDYIGKDHGLKLPENYLDGLGAVEIRKFKNELKQKNKLSDLFCDNFSIIEIDKKSKEIVTKNPLSNTVSKNLNTSSLSELHDDKLARLRESLEKINSLVNNLIEKRIKN